MKKKNEANHEQLKTALKNIVTRLKEQGSQPKREDKNLKTNKDKS